MAANDVIFYVMLDAIMDTRIGTLMRMKADFAIKATGSKEYHQRLSDDFVDILNDPSFDQGFYKKLYYDRDISTMFYSRATRMVEYLKRVIHDQAIRKVTGDPRVGALKLIINTYPYFLEGEDLTYLRRVIAAAFAQPFEVVEMDFRPLREMTLGWFRSVQPAVCAMYDFYEWSKDCADLPRTEAEAKVMVGSPETMMLVPGLLTSRHDYQKFMNMDKSDANVNDPFTTSRKFFAPAFALEVLPARYFSVQLIVEETVLMTDLNKLQKDVLTMNQIAGRVQDSKANSIIGQFEQIGEEFHETLKGLLEGLKTGDWNEFRNGLGDMIVVIWGEESVADIPMADDLDKIMQKNLSKFDKDYVTATTSLQAMQDLGYKCEIRETEVDGVKYFPILTTEAGFVIDAKGQRKEYNKDKFLKSINWSEEVFEFSHNLPKPDDVTPANAERAAQLAESLSERFATLGMAFRELMKS